MKDTALSWKERYVLSEKEINIQEIVKKEIISKGISYSCENAFLSAVIRGAGEINLSSKGFKLVLSSDNKDLIKLCNKIINRRYNVEAYIEKAAKNIGMRQLNNFRISYDGTVGDKILNECFIIKGYDFIKGISKELISKQYQVKAYLKGIFLSCGYLSTPRDKDAEDYNGKKGYHLEFNLNSNMVMDDLTVIISRLCGFDKNNIKARCNSTSLYIKSAQHISDCLAAMGASNGVMMLQEVMANRAMRNHLNRGNNFILANIDKSITAARNQIEAIEKIDRTMGLKELDARLQQTAKIRIKYPDASLTDLADITGDSKSKLNHRIRKILEIAKTIKEI